jgi:hypothetical protein
VVTWANVWTLAATAGLAVQAAVRHARLAGRRPWCFTTLAILAFAGAAVEVLTWLDGRGTGAIAGGPGGREGLLVFVVAYGILAPALHDWVAPARRNMQRAGLVTPPLALVPGFAAGGVLLAQPPFADATRLAPLLVAVALYFTVTVRLRQLPPRAPHRPPRYSTLLPMSLGTAALWAIAWFTPPALALIGR